MTIKNTGTTYSDDGEQSVLAEFDGNLATISVGSGFFDAEITLSKDDMLKFAKSIIEMIEVEK